MRRPMLPLALGVTILDEHTRLTYLETDGTRRNRAAACRHYSTLAPATGATRKQVRRS